MGKILILCASGLVAFAFPRLLIAAGVPLLKWIEEAGVIMGAAAGWINPDIALWALTLILAFTLYGIEVWKRPVLGVWKKVLGNGQLDSNGIRAQAELEKQKRLRHKQNLAEQANAQTAPLVEIVANDDDAVELAYGQFEYAEFVISVDGFVPSEANADLHLLFGDEGGWETSDYKTFPLNQGEKSDGGFILAENLASDGKRSGHIKITLYQPLINGTEKQISFESSVFTIAGVYSKFEGRGVKGSCGPMNKVQLSVYPGVIRSGNFKLYGK